MPRKPRRRSFGSITERERGRRYVLRWVENTDHGRRRVSRMFYGTYTEASRELARVQCERAGDKPVMTLGEVYEKWFLPYNEKRVEDGKLKSNTLTNYKAIWSSACRDRWQDVPATMPTPVQIQEWLDGLPNGTAKLAIVVMRGVMARAEHYELVPDNKFKKQYDMPNRAAYTHSKDVYTLEKANAVYESISDRSMAVAFILCCFGSARVGESLAVRADEPYELKSGRCEFAAVPIVRRMPHNGDEPMPDGDLKNRQSERTVLIPYPWGKRFLGIAAERRSEGCEWLCPRPDGTPCNEVLINRLWRETAGDDWIPMRNLRSSWRTFAQYEWHVDERTLEQLMGHAQQGVSGKHYIRPNIEQLADAFAKGLGITWDI